MTEAPPIRLPRQAWIILWLLTAAIGISFVDRGTLSIALGSIKRELQLHESQLGYLSSAFFMSYTAMQLVVGKLLERVHAIYLYAAAFGVWSAATALTGLTRDVHVAGYTVGSFSVLFMLRLMLGCGESFSYPATAALVTGIFPERLRGTANSLIDAGSKVGPALGIMLGTSVLIAYGWRSMFLWLGGISLLWIPLWLMATRSTSVEVKENTAAPDYLHIARKRSFWGITFGHVGGNYAWSLFVAWLPYYFERTGLFTAKQMVWMSSAPFWILSISSIGSGYLSDRLIRSGGEPIVVRKGTTSFGNLATGLCLVVAAMAHAAPVAIAAVLCASFTLGFFSSNNWALAQALAGKEGSGKWTSLQNVFANLAATIAAGITGPLLERNGNFSQAFLIAAALLIVGAFSYWFGINDRQPVTWAQSS